MSETRRAKLDRYFPRNGPCFMHPTRYARHRLVAAIRDRHKAGDSIAFLARDYERPRAAILAAIDASPDDDRMTAKEIRLHRNRFTPTSTEKP